MKKSSIILLLCMLLVFLTSCASGANDTTDESDKYNEYKQIALDALLEKISTTSFEDIASSTPFGDVAPLDSYMYKWSDNPEKEIKWLQTLTNEARNLACIEFYAVDDSTANVWVGSVIIDETNDEVLDVLSYHVFTSGVTPMMSLGFKWADVGEEVDFIHQYENGNFKEDYGIFTVIATTDQIDGMPTK